MAVYDFVNYVINDNAISKNIKGMITSSINLTKRPPSTTVTVVSDSKPLWKLAAEQGPFIKIAAIMGASAVALGAYGAHKSYPKDKAEELKHVFETGNKYHFFSSLALLGVPMCKHPYVSGSLLIAGTTLFSGACYYHAFTGQNKFGKFAPVGGTILIIGWLAMAL